MKLIRRGTFETNSSSTHAITIPKKLKDKNKHSRIFFDIGEFGWEFDTYELKDYIWTAIVELYPNDYKEYQEKIIDILKDYYDEIKFKEPKYEESYDDDGNLKWRYLDTYQGYIDHYDELTEFIEDLFNNEELLICAVRNGYVKTGNDNSWGGFDEDYFSSKSIKDEDCYNYYKGN